MLWQHAVLLCCEECPATDVHFVLRCVILVAVVVWYCRPKMVQLQQHLIIEQYEHLVHNWQGKSHVFEPAAWTNRE